MLESKMPAGFRHASWENLCEGATVFLQRVVSSFRRTSPTPFAFGPFEVLDATKRILINKYGLKFNYSPNDLLVQDFARIRS